MYDLIMGLSCHSKAVLADHTTHGRPLSNRPPTGRVANSEDGKSARQAAHTDRTEKRVELSKNQDDEVCWP